MSRSTVSLGSSSWARARLIVGTVAALAVEVVLYRSYLAGDGSFHWFTHLFAGTSLVLLIMTVVTLRRRRPVPVPLLWLVIGHLVAMGPDLLFVKEIAHRRWMDVFVAHNVSHFIPGRNLTWYLIFLACLAAYLSVLSYVVTHLQPSIDQQQPQRGPDRERERPL